MITAQLPALTVDDFIVHEGDGESPAFVGPYYSEMADTWSMMRELMIGTRAVRENAASRIPKTAAEDEDDWETRVARTEVFPMLKTTVKGLAGLVCRRDVILSDDVPADIVAHAENIDGQGTAFPVFCRQLLTDGLQTGLVGILVDCKTAPVREDGKPLTQEDEALSGVRPYWLHYTVENILSMRTTIDNTGFLVLTQLVLHEIIEAPLGPFGYANVHQYRVFRRDLKKPVGEQITFQLYQLNTEAGSGAKAIQSVANETLVKNVTGIPFVFVYIGEKTAPGRALPPLEDLGYTNIAHAQVLSDHRHSLHIASVPILVFVGASIPKTTNDDTGEEREQKIGPSDAISTPEKGDVKYVEHAGTALGATRSELKDLEARGAVQGLSMLSNEARVAETAEAKTIDKTQQDATLASAARALQDGIETALAFHAQYMKKPSGGSCIVNTDFMDITMDSTMITALSSLVAADQLDLESMWDLLIKGGILPDDFDKEGILKKIQDAVAARPVLTLPNAKGGGFGANDSTAVNDTGGAVAA